MKVTREELNPCTIQLAISCSSDQVTAGFNKALKQLGKKVRIPGFRPGMAPKKLVEDAINPQALFEAAAEEIVKNSYEAAIVDEKLEPHGLPSINIEKLEKDEPVCEFTAKIPLKPIVELTEYKGLKADKVIPSATDEEIAAQIDELRRRGGEKKEVTGRGVEEGDVAVVNLKADGESGDGRTFMVVAGQTFDGLDKAIKGMAPEEMKAAKLDFPENFQNPDWAGKKKVACQVTVRSISAVTMPELDDDFAQSLQTDNVEELKTRIKDAILDAKERSINEMLRDNLLDQIVNSSKVEVADNTWEQVVDRRLREMQAEAEQQKTTVQAVLGANGMSEEEFLTKLSAEAKVNVKRAVVIDKIFQDNKMEVTNEDVGLHLSSIAQENQVPRERFEEFVKAYGPQLREEVIFRTMASKVTDMLVEAAQITEIAENSEEKPAKKATKRTKKADKE